MQGIKLLTFIIAGSNASGSSDYPSSLRKNMQESILILTKQRVAKNGRGVRWECICAGRGGMKM